MRLRRVLAAVLAASAHVSLCTGSFLSIGLEFASAAAQAQATDLPMTPAPAQGLLCTLQTPIPEEETRTTESSCSQGSSCVAPAVLSSVYSATTVYSHGNPIDADVALPHMAVRQWHQRFDRAAIRDGPDIVFAFAASASVVKLE